MDKGTGDSTKLVIATVLIASIVVIVGLSLGKSLIRSDAAINVDPEPVESKSLLWSSGTQALINTFDTNRDDFYALRDMTIDTGYRGVARFGDKLEVMTSDRRRLSDDEIEQSDVWKTLLEKTNTFSIAYYYDIVGFFPTPPQTDRNRREIVNYFFEHPMPAKECSELYHDIPCGICDIDQADGWSIRFTWSTGEFEEERLKDLEKLYQEDDSGLTQEEIEAKYDDARDVCLQRGLREMGYENPEDY